MKASRLMAVVALLTLLNFQPSLAQDAPGCEGLEQFRAELFPVGIAWADGLREIGIGGPDWSPATLSSDDWQAYAEISLSVNRELRALEAPDWAADWLDVRVDGTALQEQVGKAAAEGGFLVVIAFQSEFDQLDQRDSETREAAISQCPDFEQFAYDWDSLDGEVEGTPVSVPTPKN